MRCSRRWDMFCLMHLFLREDQHQYQGDSASMENEIVFRARRNGDGSWAGTHWFALMFNGFRKRRCMAGKQRHAKFIDCIDERGFPGLCNFSRYCKFIMKRIDRCLETR